jgi:hypothetical protein
MKAEFFFKNLVFSGDHEKVLLWKSLESREKPEGPEKFSGSF